MLNRSVFLAKAGIHLLGRAFPFRRLGKALIGKARIVICRNDASQHLSVGELGLQVINDASTIGLGPVSHGFRRNDTIGNHALLHILRIRTFFHTCRQTALIPIGRQDLVSDAARHRLHC